ncbi:hypothetical protein V6N13_089132 [Hibiscus sabdariffa]|uniref:Uncharacterized protein n=1 Tax=Hibiscus sabdariffa TaxID=183260 RepID=A0ABR1ZS11_9ROSI
MELQKHPRRTLEVPLANLLSNSSRSALMPEDVPRGKCWRQWGINPHIKVPQVVEDNIHKKRRQIETSVMHALLQILRPCNKDKKGSSKVTEAKNVML